MAWPLSRCSRAFLSPPATPTSRFAWLLGWLAMATVAWSFADLVADALLIDRGRDSGLVGQFQAVQWAAAYLAGVIAGFGGGLLSQGVERVTRVRDLRTRRDRDDSPGEPSRPGAPGLGLGRPAGRGLEGPGAGPSDRRGFSPPGRSCSSGTSTHSRATCSTYTRPRRSDSMRSSTAQPNP